MSKSANPGELRTRVYFSRVERETNENYVEQETEVSVLTDEDDMPRPARCKWVNAHGSESWSDQALQLRNPATLTTRYNPALLDRSLLQFPALRIHPASRIHEHLSAVITGQRRSRKTSAGTDCSNSFID